MKILYFFLINFSKFNLIFATAFNAAAPLRSVVDDAALADVFGTLEVFVAEIWTFSYGKPKEFEIYGFSTSCAPYNPMFDVKQRLALFTKSKKSKSLYCAGYFIIRFDKGWVKSFCPKLITVERYETEGPFKTDLEMRQQLSRANAR